MTDADQRGAIGFAEKVLELLDEGRYTATYKYAVLLALIDVCLEQTAKFWSTARDGDDTSARGQDHRAVLAPYRSVRRLRSRWRYSSRTRAVRRKSVSDIMGFRQRHASDPSVPRWESRIEAPRGIPAARQARRVEAHRDAAASPADHGASRIGRSSTRSTGTSESSGAKSRGTKPVELSNFDNRLLLRPGVGEDLSSNSVACCDL